jgi:hypothetical protein
MAVAAPVLEQLTLAVAGFVVFVTGMIAVAAHHETATLSYRCRNKKPPGFPGGLLVFLITYPSSSRREQFDNCGISAGSVGLLPPSWNARRIVPLTYPEG